MADHTLLSFTTVFMGFFAMMNPVANTPIFLGLTDGMDTRSRRVVARRAVVLAFVVVAAFSVAGKVIFDLFGITVPAFRIAGGVLVFLIGFRLLHGETSSVHVPSQEEIGQNGDPGIGVAVSPLAVPILAGPGTITTAMNFAANASIPKICLTLMAFFAICVITYLFFVSGERLLRLAGRGVVVIVSRLMGLILTVIGAQMLIVGITEAARNAMSG